MKIGNYKIEFDFLNSILIANALLWLIPALLSIFLGGNLFNLVIGLDETYRVFMNILGELNFDVLANNEWWRIVSANFLHYNFVHLALNMYAFLYFGQLIRRFYGGRLLFVFYVLTGIGGTLASLIFNPAVASVGASAAVYGLLGVILADALRRNPYTAGPIVPREYIFNVVAYSLVLSFIPGINLFAHLGGLATGLGLGYVVDHKMSAYRSDLTKTLEKPIFYLSAALVVIAYLALTLYLYDFFISGAAG